MRIAIIALALAAACGSSSTPQKPDAAGSAQIDAKPGAVIDAPVGGVDAFATTCGKPGDVGNELGVGKFCATLNDCSNNGSAGLCSNLGDETTHFCTKFCTKGSTTDCGTGATCTCNSSNQCGCTPDSCL
ncbi:MAG TPA: hypothetical protein VL463_02635 [Kofleriaceae bacterium]|jgi:hypothetical protein|nr:hypothetical protein [Kofleriaceae bacterium]